MTIKFDAVMGNPPYQAMDNGKRDDGTANASASPVYNHFMKAAMEISDIQSLIMPGRWLTGAGKGISEFSNEMLNDTHIRQLKYFINSRDVFPGVDIKGGVIYFLRDAQYEGKAQIEVKAVDSEEKFEEYLNTQETGFFISFKELASVLAKVKQKQTETSKPLEEYNIQQITSVLKPYGLRTDVIANPAKYDLPPMQNARKKADDITIHGLLKNKRVERYVPRDYPVPISVDNSPSGDNQTDTVMTWKVFMPYAYGAGALGEVPATPILGTPIQICTETYLRIGNFERERV